jgi:endonuclease YncB( thermonuclease family)
MAPFSRPFRRLKPLPLALLILSAVVSLRLKGQTFWGEAPITHQVIDSSTITKKVIDSSTITKKVIDSSTITHQVIDGKIVKVSDGDTVTVLVSSSSSSSSPTPIKIRLLGIDAPEKSQPFGRVCRETLADEIAGKEVQVQIQSLDRYGRSIGKILLGGRDINLTQIQKGCAWHYRHYMRNQPPSDRSLYAEEEERARRQGLGLWKDSHPEAPWDYRRKKTHFRSRATSRANSPGTEADL